MRARNMASLAVLLALALPALAAGPVPRASPELTIVDSAGHAVSLSSFKGQVVVLEFLLVRCALRGTDGQQAVWRRPRRVSTIGVAFA